MLPSNLSYMDSPQKERDGSKAAATRVNLQTYIRHRKWALGGPCRHGICEHRSANR